MAEGLITRRGGVGVSFVQATGGTVFDFFENGIEYRAHEFTQNSTNTNFEVTNGGEIEFILVAGGGSGTLGAARSSAGGAGGVIARRTQDGTNILPIVIDIEPGVYPVVVPANVNGDRQKGGNCTFNGYVAMGGGAGSHIDNPDKDGGCGAGGSPIGYGATEANGGHAIGINNLGHSGGSGRPPITPTDPRSGGSGSIVAPGGDWPNAGNGPGLEIDFVGRPMNIAGTSRSDNNIDFYGHSQRPFTWIANGGIALIRYRI